MPKKRGLRLLLWLCAVLMIATIFCSANSSQAFKQGKTYDKNNYQEVKDQLVPPVLTWIQKGDIILHAGTLDYELTLDEKYQKLSQKNEGKFDVNADGILVHKDTGKLVEFLMGNPSPTIDPKDPKAAEKILENFKYTIHYRLQGSHGTGYVRWHSTTGLEREILSQEYYLYYQNREIGPMKNLNNYSFQWKLIGDQTFFCPFGSTSKVIIKRLPDGSITRVHDVMKRGYEVPGWPGIGYAPANTAWIPRDCWIVEANHKDPCYGKMMFY